MKICSKCKIEKLEIAFYKTNANRDSLRSHCKICVAKCSKAYNESNKEKIADLSKAYRECNREKLAQRRRAYYENNQEKLAQRHKVYYENNRQNIAEYKKLYSACNQEKVAKAKQAYQQANCKTIAKYQAGYYELNKRQIVKNVKVWQQDNRETVQRYKKTWVKSNPGKCNANTAKRRTLKLQAFPQWARGGEHKVAIEAVYSEAKRLEAITGIPHHVDHIHPLKNPLICGLHVAANLRPIPATLNLTKNNKFVPYVESDCINTLDVS